MNSRPTLSAEGPKDQHSVKTSKPLVDRVMKPKNAMFPGSLESYRLQLRLVAAEPCQQPLWDRSGAARESALRAGLLDSTAEVGRKSAATQH